MSATSSPNIRNVGIKGVAAAFASCVIGLAIMILTFGLSPERDSAIEQKNPPSKEPDKKPDPTWNVALGNVVIVVPELGLTVKGPAAAEIEPSRVAAKIESQLLTTRKLYRMESDNKPSLMGGLLLQLTLGSSGEVMRVRELDSHIADEDFRKAVIDEAGKWEFSDIASEGTTINCPLLFVREGMEITTVIRWEKTLGLFEQKTALRDSSERSKQETKANAPSSQAENRARKPTGSGTPSTKQPGKKRSTDIFENSRAATIVEI